MTLPSPLPAHSELAASVIHVAAGAFSLESDATDPNVLSLVISLGGTRALWTRHFGDLADRDAVLERFHAGALDILFFGRVTMIFGPAAITAATDGIVESERASRFVRNEAEAQRRRDHKVIELYAPDTNRGFKLELRRRSADQADWSVRYDRAIERDRLCDWMMWQQSRFSAFLDHAAEQGAESLTRLLTDEMFETERRVKKEGRGAGGMRPLRMWRGD
jgi:hypothetical protein